VDWDADHFAIALLQSMPDAVIYADAEGTIRCWNAGAQRMFGYSATEALGRSLDIIIPESLRQRHWDGFARTMLTGETRYGADDLLAVPAVRKDGTRISIEFTVTAFPDQAGKILGIAAVMRDVTKRFEEIRALRKRIAELTPSRET